MYLPYLRGRQYELIGLREMVDKGLLSKNIIPIIEPVKLSSTLINTIEAYKNAKRCIAIITNPMVGEFEKEYHEEKNKKLLEDFKSVLKENDHLVYIRILKKDDKKIDSFIEKHENKMGTVCISADSVRVYEDYFSSKESKYNLMPDESTYRRKVKHNKVLLAERFNKQKRNEDYMKIDDEPFSEDHLYYKEDGYIGFSDYSIVGKEYVDTGFAPYAVAIHMVYYDNNESLRIKHFVSDTNDDISDIAGKFSEALEKLVKWNKEVKMNTYAVNEFEDLYNRQSYPGLGTVKKLSIMHHLELVGQYLDRN